MHTKDLFRINFLGIIFALYLTHQFPLQPKAALQLKFRRQKQSWEFFPLKYFLNPYLILNLWSEAS